jgi:hypothetical protein
LSNPYKFVSILFKTTGQYTFTLKNGNTELIQKSGQGTGEYQFCIFSDLNLLGVNVYELYCVCTETLYTYQLDLADICLCQHTDC